MSLQLACNWCFTLSTPEKPLLECSRCFSACYCKRECQRSDWKFHKVNCIPSDHELAHVKRNLCLDIIEFETNFVTRTFFYQCFVGKPGFVAVSLPPFTHQFFPITSYDCAKHFWGQLNEQIWDELLRIIQRNAKWSAIPIAFLADEKPVCYVVTAPSLAKKYQEIRRLPLPIVVKAMAFQVKMMGFATLSAETSSIGEMVLKKMDFDFFSDLNTPGEDYFEQAISRNPGPSRPSEAIHANTFQNPYLAKSPDALQGRVLQDPEDEDMLLQTEIKVTVPSKDGQNVKNKTHTKK